MTAQLLRILMCALLCSIPAQAADRYLRVGATGSNNGTDWTNAWTVLSTAETNLARGDVLYVADGTYSEGSRVTFNVAASGTTLITVKKATVSAHGTATGWSDTFGDGQAVFTMALYFLTDYWTFDGVVGGGPTDWEGAVTAFGFKLDGDCIILDQDNSVNGGDNLTYQHFETDGHASGTPSSNCPGLQIRQNNNLTIRYFYIHHINEDVFKLADGGSDIIVEYGKTKLAPIEQDGTHHGDLFECANSTWNRITIRWSFFEDAVGSYLFGAHETCTVNDYFIYGNILDFRTREQNTGNCQFGHLSGGGTINNIKAYNNTIAGIFGASCFAFYSPWTGTPSDVSNNIWVEITAASYTFSFSSVTHTTNTCYEVNGNPCEQNLTGSPFVNYSTQNYSLSSSANTAQTAGTILGTPFNVDMLGVTYGGDGKWNRGALEFDEGAPQATTGSGRLRRLR